MFLGIVLTQENGDVLYEKAQRVAKKDLSWVGTKTGTSQGMEEGRVLELLQSSSHRTKNEAV